MPGTVFLAGASIRQYHHDDGSVDVYFDAILQGPRSGESGVLTVSADSESWSASQQVVLSRAGENIVSVKVSCPFLMPPQCLMLSVKRDHFGRIA